MPIPSGIGCANASRAARRRSRFQLAARHYRAATFPATGEDAEAAIDVIRNSLKELGILDFIPEAKVIYNDKFVPVNL